MRSQLRARLARALVAALVLVMVTPVAAHADRSTAAEKRLVELMNAERASAGLAPLKVADDLRAVAYGWSVELAARYGSAGGTAHNPALADAVCCWSALAENVGWASGSNPVPAAETVHRTFLDSSSHRSNIVDSRFTEVGVGVEVHRSGTVYVTVDFRRRSGAAPPSPAPKTSSSPAPEPAPAPAPKPAPPPEPDEDAAERAEAARRAEAERLEARRAELESRRTDLRARYAEFEKRRIEHEVRRAGVEKRRAEVEVRRTEIAARQDLYVAVVGMTVDVLRRVDAVLGAVQGQVLAVRSRA